MTLRAVWATRAVLGAALVVYAVPAALSSGADWGYWLLVGWIGWPVMGALVVLRASGNVIGWLMVGLGSLFGLGAAGWLLGSALPAAAEAVLWSAAYMAWSMLALIVVLLPDGRVHNRLGRVLVWLVGGLAVAMLVLASLGRPQLEGSGRVNPLLVPLLEPLASIMLSDVGFAVVPGVVIVALVDLVRRGRRSDGEARAQFRWILFGAGVTAVSLLTFFIGESPQWAAVFLNAIPLSIGVAVLRYRLFEIDRIVSRTVSYAVVTGVVLGTYGLVVMSVSRLLPESGALPVAGATLVAAGVFRPVLGRVRGAVDRRFDRARFDGVRAAEAFAGRLASAVDPDEVATDLAGTVQATLAPRSVGVWLAGAR